jgi:hypothetical protein
VYHAMKLFCAAATQPVPPNAVVGIFQLGC